MVLQQALADLSAAYRNFFASVTGKRKGPRVAPPRFRSRKDRRQAIRFTRNARFTITTGGKLRLPKIGDVPVRWSRDLPSAPTSVTVIVDASRNRDKARIEVARLHARVADTRRDWLHKESTRVIRDNQAVGKSR